MNHTPNIINTTSKIKHPKGLYILFFTEMWERFSYYGLRAILILFMTKVLLFNKTDASLTMATFTTFIYSSMLIGGYIADRYWGNRLAIYFGGVMIALAQFVFFYSAKYTHLTWDSLLIAQPSNFIFHFFDKINVILTTPSHVLLYIGIFFMIIGNGFFKPNISNLVGDLYAPTDVRKDAAYGFFYMGINLGAFISPLVCGYLINEQTNDYQYGFLVAGIGMLLGLFVFNFGKKYLVDINGSALGLSVKKVISINTDKTQHEKLTLVELQKIGVIFILMIFMVMFWGCFEQAGTALTYYADERLDKNINLFGIQFYIKASYFQSVNPLCILIFTPFFAHLWLKLIHRNKEMPSIIKMVFGMLLVGLGFYLLVIETYFNPTNQLTNPLWLIAAYTLHTFGELCLSPIGLSIVNKLSPKKFASFMFAVWFLAPAFGNYLAGKIGSLYPEKGKVTHLFGWNISQLSDYFLLSTLLPIISGLLLFCTYPMLKKWMHGVK